MYAIAIVDEENIFLPIHLSSINQSKNIRGLTILGLHLSNGAILASPISCFMVARPGYVNIISRVHSFLSTLHFSLP